MPFRTLSQERSGAEQNPSVCNLVSPYRMCPASFRFSGLEGAEITLFPWHLQEYSPFICTSHHSVITALTLHRDQGLNYWQCFTMQNQKTTSFNSQSHTKLFSILLTYDAMAHAGWAGARPKRLNEAKPHYAMSKCVFGPASASRVEAVCS